MNRFSIQHHIEAIYGDFPAGSQRPVIGITANYGEQSAKLADGYYKHVLRAGGTPLIIPPLADRDTLMNTLSRIDGLLLSGGADINPLYCNEQPRPQLGAINAERDLPELLITRLAANRQLPILGICRGIQTLAVALGGTVEQDIAAGASIKHSQDADRSVPTHTVTIESGSILFGVMAKEAGKEGEIKEAGKTGIIGEIGKVGKEGKVGKTGKKPAPSSLEGSLCCDAVAATAPLTLPVNSFHHQAVASPGPHLLVSAKAPDGTIEAIESSEHKPLLGVQWHPECMGDDGLPLFRWLVDEAAQYHRVQKLHDRVLTLDTHCDTPMFFPQNIDFARRDDRIRVDLHKMQEGRLDATIMVAYLPQPKMGETFSSKVSFPVKGPKEYADLIFDKIQAIVAAHSSDLAIASTPGDLYENKRHGRKSIMLGIENGLALGGQLQNIGHFAERGVVYITLCHNGDNDLCDSCRGSNVHRGVSRFGEQVIREMNRLGLMVDLSHASEKSFYDALDISKTPIVCSHSSCRALCDHPRNLTDEQMRRLAKAGGVMQVTLYNGFLRKDEKATIIDAIDHLDHAVKVMGIDHVGLGTDFDGDGGVPGLADASELTHFTRLLLQRKYAERDIQKLWGGNFLRVMGQVQRMRE